MRKAHRTTKGLAFFVSVVYSLGVPAGCATCSAYREGLAGLLEDTIYYSAGNTVNASGIWSPS